MKCPRCSAKVSLNPDSSGFIVCPGCGARLRSKAVSAARPQSSPGSPAPKKEGDIDSALARLDAQSLSPDVTLPPTSAPRGLAADKTRAPASRPMPAPAPPLPDPAGPASLERVLTELAALRRTQEEILGLLRSRPAAPPSAAAETDEGYPREAAAPGASPGRRKSVLLIDDDERTGRPAVEALQRAGVPVRAVSDGNAGLAAIAEDKPDVIVMELGIGGAMAGKDVVNMIKATMEWVDIPIILHTRIPVENQKEARTIHGADDLVLKAPDSSQVVVSRVLALFRKA